MELTRRNALRFTGTSLAGAVTALSASALSAPPALADTIEPVSLPAGTEPTIEEALRWWTPARQVWTPVGWKGHLFRFNSFYNGDLVCRPGPVLSAKGNVEPYRDTNFQLTVKMPGRPTNLFDVRRPLWDADSGWRKQRWDPEHDTPVLQTDFPRQEGLVVRQSVFGHVPGGGELATGTEPLYAWIRYEVVHVDEVSVDSDLFTFSVLLSKACIVIDGPYSNEFGVVATRDPALAPIADGLRMDRVYNPTGRPISIPVYAADDSVRLVVRTSQNAGATLGAAEPDGVFDLRLMLPVVQGATIDLVVPMLTGELSAVQAEVDLGREATLAQADAFWSPKPTTTAAISVPDAPLAEFLRRTPQLAEVVAELSRDPAKPDSPLRYSFLSGSHGYDVLWSTPTSMISHMFLDPLGYHEVVDRHTRIYSDMQGKQHPPGSVFGPDPHPGYLGTPTYLQSIDWLSDHGAILEIVSRHALLTNDPAFLAEWTERIVKACEFVVWACGLSEHRGVKGLMPPGVATDEGIDTQGIGVQCWTYKGLRSAITLLDRLGHPKAAGFRTFADQFQQTYQDALEDLAEQSPTWTDPDGKQQPVLGPVFTDEPQPWIGMTRFDTGALMSVWAGLLPGDDPLMMSFLDFFRHGPDHALFDRAHHNGLDRVILEHEVGSGEPCYSWNLMHTWHRGQKDLFLEGMYGLLTYAHSMDTFISCEHRNAMWGNLFAVPLTVWALRHAIVDDAIEAGQLHVLRLAPASWLRQGSTFERMPTIYGPVSITVTEAAGGEVDISVSGAWHQGITPPQVIVHVPGITGIRSARINGRRVRIPPGRTVRTTL